MKILSNAETSMELSFPSELGYEVIARDAVAAFARRFGFAAEQIEDVKTALCEACINAIEHGNSLQPSLRVMISCQVDGERLLIEVHDQGVRPHGETSEPLTIAQKVMGMGRLRGMGLMLIKALTDESGFIDDSHAGNCFRLAFQRRHSAI